jgi:hypothetical protein
VGHKEMNREERGRILEEKAYKKLKNAPTDSI